MLSRIKKEKLILKIKKIIEKSSSIVVATLNKVSTNDLTKLRNDARAFSVYIYVIKNRLIRHIVKGTSFDFLLKKDVFVGSSIVAFSTKEPRDAARVFLEFYKNHEFFKIKGAAFHEKFFSESEIDFLYNFPSYKEAIFKLILVIKESSILKLIRVLYLYNQKKSIV